jgi:2-dehydropantoate 2-reductase
MRQSHVMARESDPASAAEALTVGVMGAGAVGMFFAQRLARAGAEVTAVARPAHVDVVTREGLTVVSVDGTSTVRFRATTDAGALRACDIVLVCVKAVDTDEVADLLSPTLRHDALVVSLQNGVDNAWRLRARMTQAVVPAVVYVSVEMAGPGQLRHNGGGRVVVGAPLAGSSEIAVADARLAALLSLFERAEIVCRHSDDIRIDLWTKLATNCAYNAVSAISGLRYGRLVADAGVRGVMDATTTEVAAVAAAEGVPVSRDALARAVAGIAEVMPGAISSTAQDLHAGRRTEIDHLNGFVVRRGAALGVATPVNQTLQALVKLVEREARRAE